MAPRSRSPEIRSCGRSISVRTRSRAVPDDPAVAVRGLDVAYGAIRAVQGVDIDAPRGRSEEHTSELQSHSDLVCRLLLEKKNGIRCRRGRIRERPRKVRR